MTTLTLQDVLSHQHVVPWPELYQVEQDLLLSLAMRAVFTDSFLSGQLAMRGGTVLHKVHLTPPARYSEDIDLVVVGDRPEEHIKKALIRVLRPVLGKEKSSAWANLRLAVRNAARPSRILRCIYKRASVSEPGRTLTLELEVNVTERTPLFELQRLPFAFQFRDESLACTIVSYDLHEMLGTKMRAMLQRRKGRDLFDLYWALNHPAEMPVSPGKVLEAFVHYMRNEGSRVHRAEFLDHLDACLADTVGYGTDMRPLLRRDLDYDPQVAGRLFKDAILSRLPLDSGAPDAGLRPGRS
ncbi:MAG: nucleotidyl transferase AbiEii/AbiGii toxin family protein [Betaproteobacteria bacterium]|nr:nucleotidyl transferase AbiEii/AbiGii toxin family protein [Betaproteobacteria bacterium]